MFTLKKSRTFTWPVSVYEPDAGKHVRAQFTATFRVMDRDDLQTRMREISDPELPATEQARRMGDFLSAVVVQVEGVQVADESGGTVSMTNRDICEALIADTFAGPALFDAYVEGIAGRNRKN
jgi:hypothetical protein